MLSNMSSIFYFYYDLLLKTDLPLTGYGYGVTYPTLSKGIQKRRNSGIERETIYVGHTWFDHMRDCYPLSKLQIYLSSDSTKVYFRVRGSDGLWPEALGLRLPTSENAKLFLVGHDRTEAYWPRWQGSFIPARQWLNFKKEIPINLADYQEVIHKIIKIVTTEPVSLKIWKEAGEKASSVHLHPRFIKLYE